MLNDLKKHRFALYLILCLCLAKFVLEPLFLHQQDIRSEQALLTKKLVKLQGLSAAKGQLVEQAKDVEAQLNRLTPLLYPEQKSADFQLAEQKKIESQLKRYELDKKNIGWKTAYQLEGTRLTKLQVEYRFSGPTTAAMDYISSLMIESHLVDFEEFGVSFRAQRPGRVGIATVFLRRNYYMQMKEVSNGQN